ncbi:MAG: glycosyltransferase [Candidatus Bathyarchaeia archaeon]
MNISILHHSLNSGGGSERVCLEMISALKRGGHNVIMCTFERTNWANIKRYYGEVIIPDEEIIIPKFALNFTYGEMLNFSLLTLKICKWSDVIIMSSTSPNIFGIANVRPCIRGKKIIVYVNMPPFISRKGQWRFYYAPYVFLQRKLFHDAKNIRVLANSSFVAKIIKETFRINPDVVYPPVNIEKFYVSEKQDFVVSLGRFNQFKRFEVLINSFVKVGKGKCIIMGSVANNAFRESVAYVRKLRGIIEKLGIADRVSLLVNCPFQRVREILSKSKLYVNCTMFEPFGISVVEGMVSGCVPIVHKSGGPYTDIIEYDKYGFSFINLSDLAQKIGLLLKEKDLYCKYSKKAAERAKIFCREKFHKEILSIVESAI